MTPERDRAEPAERVGERNPPVPGSPAADPVAGGRAGESALRRYRLPVALAIVALCLYLGSIVYIAFIRGPVA